MTDFAGAKVGDLHSSSAGINYVLGWVINDVPSVLWNEEKGHHDDFLKALGDPIAGVHTITLKTPHVPNNFAGAKLTMPQDDFFEKLLITPRSIDAGLLLATFVDTIDIYSTYKSATRVFQSYVNNAGAGVVITDLPGLPTNIPPQSGLTLTLNVLLSGPPTIDGTLDFTFDTGLEQVALTGTRMTMFPFEPIEITERLQFKTDILTKRNGLEQRVALRSNPRHILNMVLSLQDLERQSIDAITMDSHGRAFGVPLWWEPAIAQGGISVTDTVVEVDSTSYSDLTVGNLAVTWADGTGPGHEILEISALTETSITFATAYTKAFPAGTRIMPVRFANMNRTMQNVKYPIDLQESRIQFTFLDVTDIGDTSAFPSFNSKVLLDEANVMDGNTLRETLNRPLIIVDNQTGVFETSSFVDVSRRGHPKTFFSNTRKRLWEIRQLIHALKGKAISFYIPTFYEDFNLTTDIVSAQNTMRFENFGYTKHVQSRQPRDVVRIVKTDGTSVTRTVQSSTEIDPTEEQIIVDAIWGENIAVAEVRRIEFIEKVRADSDEIAIKHKDARGGALVRMPLMAVLD